jgi:hypothetical protein
VSNIVLKGEILPPSVTELRMPAGTPLGMGILGSMKFAAIRRVLEHAGRAEDARASLLHSQAAVADAYIAREVARERLRNVDTICDQETDRIQSGARITRLRNQLEVMELEARVAERQAALAPSVPASVAAAPASKTGGTPADIEAFLEDLRHIPGIVRAVAEVKEQIVSGAGGEERLSDAERASCEVLDGMLQAFMSRKGGDAVL